MILILGVTASGKSKLAFELARTIGAEIVSIDSMKVYKRMDLGTAKPAFERQKQVKYHLIDVVEPFESFSVDRFLALTDAAIEQIQAAGKPVIAAGGTAMYIKTLLYGLFEGPGSEDKLRQELKDRIQTEGTANLHAELAAIDPPAAERIHPNDERRIIRALEVYQLTGKPISSFQKQFKAEQMRRDWTIIGLRRPKPIESSRINLRVKKMIEAGLVDEVRSLLAENKPLSKQAACAIGYAEIIDHLNGNLSLEEAIEKIKINTRRLAKGQRTWFKTFKNVNWIDASEDDTEDDILQKTLALIDP
ncbi:MAG TPA: tRNA (adenosine(37)-N6)-dimethylallyltransferase MiaA [Phycisphaerales bacterium]|nr:tRNA (adenosine(37)-N6)-dimethylallyltransferase MiaA [Phycisphaerales bacterium]